MTPQRSRRARARGFTTMEALVAAGLTLVIALAVLGFFDAQQRAYATLSTYAMSQTVTRTVVDLMSREIRMSSYDPTLPRSAGALALSPMPTCPNVEQGLVVAMPQRIQIQQDLTGDGVISAANENIVYEQVGDEIQRTDVVTATTATLVENVPDGGFTLRYFDNQAIPVEIVPGGAPAALTETERACVEKVQIEVAAMIDDPYPNKPDVRSVVRSAVTIRNRTINKF